MQALYQWQINPASAMSLVHEFINEDRLGHANKALFRSLVEGVLQHVDALDAVLEPLLERDIRRLDPVSRAILRLAAYECLHTDLPTTVIMDEAINLAKQFGQDGGHRFINGVLDKLVHATPAH